MRLHPLPRVLVVSLAALLAAPSLGADPAPTAAPAALVIQVRPADIGEGRSRLYAVGEVMDLAVDVAPPELVSATTANSVMFSRRGYYRQTIVGGCFGPDGASTLRPQETIRWVEAGDVARVLISGALVPAGGGDHTLTYRTDRTLIRWEFLGEGLPPRDPNAKIRLGGMIPAAGRFAVFQLEPA